MGCRLLSKLDIKKCFGINDVGMLYLSQFAHSLRQINLSYCSVTDVGLLSLSSISGLQNMTIVHLAVEVEPCDVWKQQSQDVLVR
ncbi:hypothetical protein ZEAMMB73_Zm00001d044625 [Zea mays]|uniref:Uncharacterized protein n=2 Tax=Zea mays TaxID=4577 RepID=A0A1D6NQ47_MAIZE|nr:hypothetical protein ZEAMMB73_Zm00001d044625 [Zea mays]